MVGWGEEQEPKVTALEAPTRSPCAPGMQFEDSHMRRLWMSLSVLNPLSSFQVYTGFIFLEVVFHCSIGPQRVRQYGQKEDMHLEVCCLDLGTTMGSGPLWAGIYFPI